MAAGISRIVNVLAEITSINASTIFQVYQPGWLNPYDIVTTAKYSGYITSLRLTIEITSIPEMKIVAVDTLDSDDTIAEKKKETFNGNRKKCLRLWGSRDGILIKISDIYLFNQQPFYYLDLIPYLTSAGSFDVGNDLIIFGQMIDVGDGLLFDVDRILILGSVFESASGFDQSTLSLE